MTKSEMCLNIVQQEMTKSLDKKAIRAASLVRIIKECNMTVAGANTYYSNARNKIDNPGSNEPKIRKERTTAVECTHTPFTPTGIDPTERGVYSVVDVSNNVAVFASCHHNKQDALIESVKKNRPVVNGLQVIGKVLGTIEKGTKV
mgnify:FL=1